MEPVKKANKTIFGKFGKKAFCGLLIFIFALTIASIEILSVYADTCSEFEISFATNTWLSSGKYEQDVKGRIIGQNDLEGSFLSSTPYGSFYSPDGQLFANGTLYYTNGMFKNYNIGCKLEKNVAEFPRSIVAGNVVNYLGQDLCAAPIAHPAHKMEEMFIVDGTKVKYYEDGLECNSTAETLKMKLESKALQYSLDLGGIPVSDIKDEGLVVDTSYRGKILFMGSNEYYVNDLNKTYITLAKGEKIIITGAGYTEPTLPELQGYKFKLKNLTFSGCLINGIIVEIEKPDGTTVPVTVTKQISASLGEDTAGHQVQIQAFQGMGNEATIIAYDMSTQYTLENNTKQDGWRVKIEKDTCDMVGIEYYVGGNANTRYCLTKLTLTQEDTQTLNVGDNVSFPTNAVKFYYKGFKDEYFGDVKCSGGDDKIKIDTSDNRKVLLSFTTRDRERLNNVRLDEGGYNIDELFLIGNTVYKFRGTQEVANDENQIKLLLSDVSNVNDFEVILTKLGGDFAGFNYTYFDKYSTNKENPCNSPCSTFNGTVPQIQGVMAYFHEGKLWMDKGNDNNIGLNNINLRDIQNDNCPASLTTLFESGNDLNNETTNNNTDDQILVFTGCGGDETYIDFYDTSRKMRGVGDYRTSVKITGRETALITPNCYTTTALGFEGVLKCNNDTKLWSPRGADRFTVTNYGSDKQVKGVEICHPTKRVFMTYYLGKEKEQSELITTITQDDVGKSKKVGCCEAIVKSSGNGEVKLASKSWRMIGKYEQDIKGRMIGQTDLEGSFLTSTPYGSFYYTEGQLLANGTLNYTHGMLKNYTIGWGINKSVADFPIEVMNRNEVCYLCYNISQEEVKHPDHEMKESIIVNGTKVKYYEDGLGCDSKAESLKMKLEGGAIQYTVDLGGIPVRSITNGSNLIDSAYRGKVLFMGSNDYYVNNLDVNDLDKRYITLAKGEKLQISNASATEPTLPELQGYKFKLLEVIQSNGKDVGVVIEVEKPNGTTVNVNATKQGGALLGKDTSGHQVQIQVFQIMRNNASIIAYDMSTQYKLENNKKQDGWRVKIEKDTCDKVGIEDYGNSTNPVGNASQKYCLTKLTLTQEDAQTLNVGDNASFLTNAVKFSYEGFKDEDFGDVKCSGGGDKIKIDTSDNRKVLLSFTTRDGERLNNVRLDEGGYEIDELFLIGNTVYKFGGIEETYDENHIKLLLSDVSNANDFEVILTRLGGNFAGFNYTYFDRHSMYKENPCYPPCRTFNGIVLPGVMAYFHEGRLWMDKGNDNKIGLNDIDLTDIQNDNCPASLTTLFESGNDLNEEGVFSNTDDQILVFTGCGGDKTYIDFYDKSKKMRGVGDYRTSVKITGEDAALYWLNPNTVCYNLTNFGFEGVLRCNEDTKLWSPRGADLFTVTNYGSDKQVKAVEICHPTKKAYVTFFLGKEKEEAETIGTITAADVGKLKKIGCGEATVKSVGMTNTSCNNTGTCTSNADCGVGELCNALHQCYTPITMWSGKYEQDIKGRMIGQTDLEGSFLSSTPYGSFFYSIDGQLLANGILNYTHGMLKNYTIGCEINKSVANFPIEVMNRNEVCYLCYNTSQEEVKHPDHEMKESIIVDGTKVKYYEDGLWCDSKAELLKMKLESGAIQYTVELGGIPVRFITNGSNLIDSAYRGKMLFMGSNDYYVNDLDKTYIILAKGERLDINSEGYTEATLPELEGYKFKLKNNIQTNCKTFGAIIEVEKPDGTTVQVTVTKQTSASLGKDVNGHILQIQIFQVMGNNASIIAYDMSTQYKLENNKKQDGWRVRIERDKCNNVGIDDYGTHADPVGNAYRKYCLTKLTLTQEDAQILNVGDTVFFPTKAVKFSYEGFKDEDFGDVKCSGGDDKIKINTSSNRKVLLSFTTRDEKRLNNVRLDEGGYEINELFLIGDTVYKFRGTEDIANDGNHIKLLLSDVSNASDFKVTLTKLGGSFVGFNYTYFNRYSLHKENPCSPPCSTFNGTVPQIQGVMAYFHEGKLWMDKGNDNNIGLNDIDLTDIQNDNCPGSLTTLFESGNDLNDEWGVSNTDDQILVFTGCGEDETYIDFYDTERRARGGDYKTSVKITGEYNGTQLDFEGVLECSEDTKLWSPRGADMFTVTNYGDNQQVKAVEICHPTRKAYVTYFIGKVSSPSWCQCDFDFDGNRLLDIFDAVEALEYLSEEKKEVSNKMCSNNTKNITLQDVLILMENL